MANLKSHESLKDTTIPTTEDEEYSLAGEVAWEYCKLKRIGKNPLKSRYRNQLHSTQSREEFDMLVSFDEFIEHTTEFSAANPKSE